MILSWERCALPRTYRTHQGKGRSCTPPRVLLRGLPHNVIGIGPRRSLPSRVEGSPLLEAGAQGKGRRNRREAGRNTQKGGKLSVERAARVTRFVTHSLRSPFSNGTVCNTLTVPIFPGVTFSVALTQNQPPVSCDGLEVGTPTSMGVSTLPGSVWIYKDGKAGKGPRACPAKEGGVTPCGVWPWSPPFPSYTKPSNLPRRPELTKNKTLNVVGGGRQFPALLPYG